MFAKLPDTTTKVGGFSFFLTIVAFYLLGTITLFTWSSLFEKLGIQADRLVLFACGSLGAFVIISTSSVPKLRVFLHELKHACLVVATGNKLKGFHVDTHSGHVTYSISSKKLHLAPLITIAPYCMPLFSAPALIAAIILGEDFSAIMCFIVGATLATDLTTGYQEMHPHQSDLRRIFGGIVASGICIYGAYFAWVNICLIWLVGGRSGYVYTFDIAFVLARTLFET